MQCMLGTPFKVSCQQLFMLLYFPGQSIHIYTVFLIWSGHTPFHELINEKHLELNILPRKDARRCSFTRRNDAMQGCIVLHLVTILVGTRGGKTKFCSVSTSSMTFEISADIERSGCANDAV